MFSDRGNFQTEILTFEVVDFEGSYHAILGHLCYAKFMAVPNYTYLKLNMLGPNGVIMVSGSFEQAYAYRWEHFELDITIAIFAELKRLRVMVVEGIPDRNEQTPSCAFCPTEDTNAVEVDPSELTKTMRIRTQLPTK
ncbi:uncharacterized protein LOC112899547 [Panicum hallii]|jgi:hypothetical protein|uniref:uncharacterized protein LOC112899547 n=1 Tax=Panicum hallii TaxID=206008 RepID=UPI000DF4CD6A|nr:uncharacterized protein LOC112899547 [Panicum hallii]